MMNSTADLVFLVALFSVVVLVPVLARLDMRNLERDLAKDPENARSRSFARSILLQWTVAGALLILWGFTTLEPRGAFLVPGWTGGEWLAVAAGWVVSLSMIVQTWALRNRERTLAKIRDQLGSVARLAPRNRREQGWFDALSVTAGICEEFVYRGLLLGALAALIGLWPAVIGSTLLFGLAHAYQGVGGVVRTGAFGAVGALLTVFSGSIWVAVAVHAIVDLSQGRLVAMAVRSGEETRESPLQREAGAVSSS